MIQDDYAIGRFTAMGCPCEILLDTMDRALARDLYARAVREALRIEQEFSRYRAGTIVDQINQSNGKKVKVDEETAALLDYAAACYEISGGLFDITTGVLRKGTGPDYVGWDKVHWDRPYIHLPPGFEVDFGGMVKEYAADRILELLRQQQTFSMLVNLGGDIAAAGHRLWSVGIEAVDQPGAMAQAVPIRQGGMATSGTTKRAGHILNPRTGQPVLSAPRSVTVAAKTCTEAGFWSTLAILQGQRAERFLLEQSLEAWCYR